MAYTFYKTGIGSAFAANAAASVVRPFISLQLEQPGGGAWWYWSTFNRDKGGYSGNGYLLDVEFPEENAEMRDGRMAATITGCDSSVIQSVQGYSMYDKLEMYLGLDLLDADGNAITNTGYTWLMYLSEVDILQDIELPTFRVTGSNYTAFWNRPMELTYTSRCQQVQRSWKSPFAQFTADTGFDHVPNLQDWTGFWGKERKDVFPKRYKDKGGL